MLLIIILSLSCSSEEQKMQKVIKDFLYQTLDDYKSYEPIEFQPADSLFSDWTMDSLLPKIESDYSKMKAIADSLEIESKRKAGLGYSLDNVTDDINMYIIATYYTKVAYSEKRDSIKNNFVSEFIGYGINHSFRAKNRMGGTERHNYQFVLSPDKTRVIMVNDIDAGEEITNYSKILNKNELEELKLQSMLLKYPDNKEKGLAFLEENKKDERVVVTDSGLQYRVIKEGKGRKPREKSVVEYKSKAKDVNGETLFDYTDSPKQTGVNRVIKGMSEALQLMSPGAIYEICIPWDLAFGEKGNDYMPPYTVMIEELELIDIIEY